MKILIVEDDKSIVSQLSEILLNALYEVAVINDFNNVYEEIIEENPDLVLLDINLPFNSGEEILQRLRKNSTIPVIMVTSEVSEAHEVLSMSYGADDYITKPYNPTILLLRINSILKRISNASGIMQYKDAVVNLKKGVIIRETKEVILTKNEMIIFSYLLTHKERIVTRDELMTDLWDNNEYINDNALTVNISRLRGKLVGLGLGDSIETRKGQGYILL